MRPPNGPVRKISSALHRPFAAGAACKANGCHKHYQPFSEPTQKRWARRRSLVSSPDRLAKQLGPVHGARPRCRTAMGAWDGFPRQGTGETAQSPSPGYTSSPLQYSRSSPCPSEFTPAGSLQNAPQSPTGLSDI